MDFKFVSLDPNRSCRGGKFIHMLVDGNPYRMSPADLTYNTYHFGPDAELQKARQHVEQAQTHKTNDSIDVA